MKATNRRGFLARIFAGAIAAPAVTKLIANGVAKPVTVSDPVTCYGCSGDMEGCGGTPPYMTKIPWDCYPPIPKS